MMNEQEQLRSRAAEPGLAALSANLSALEALLEDMTIAASKASKSLDEDGDLPMAIGHISDMERKLSLASALYHTCLALRGAI